MTDVFVSYARSTQGEALRIAEGLRAAGYSVWRDEAIPANRPYADVIQERLRDAKAVIVIWSADAAASDWVRSEADFARLRHKLVQLTTDGAPLPMPFDQIQCADLSAWSGDEGSIGWRQVVEGVSDLVGSGAIAPPSTRRDRSICVLPFSNMSGDPEQEYFSDGISEDVITDLSKVSSVFVVARHTAFAFKGKNIDLRQVAEQLGVTHVLEGSVRKAGGRVRITAQLIDGATGGHIWAERYDRDLNDIFALQDEISQAIVGALRVRLLPAERGAIQQRGTTNADAYNLYLMARGKYLSGNNQGPQRSQAVVRLCQRAVSLDASYARAWALMASAQGASHYIYGEAETGYAAAEKALGLDPDLAEAHAVKAKVLCDRGWRTEAEAELKIALRLDPNSYDVNMSAGFYSYRGRELADARAYYERASQAPEATFDCFGMLVSVYAALADPESMKGAAHRLLAQAESALQSDDTQVAARAYGAYALAALGNGERAREWIDRALLIEPDNLGMRYNMACAVSFYLRDADMALEILAPFMAACTADFLAHVRADPDLDPLRGDERFKAMIGRAEDRLAAGAS